MRSSAFPFIAIGVTGLKCAWAKSCSRCARADAPHDGPKMPNSVGVQLAFRVAPDEVETCHNELVQKQVEIIEAPRDWDYGHRTLFFKDPDGNILEIYAEV